jgi:hypothetical protein
MSASLLGTEECDSGWRFWKCPARSASERPHRVLAVWRAMSVKGEMAEAVDAEAGAVYGEERILEIRRFTSAKEANLQLNDPFGRGRSI